jgi:6-phosphogluconate dehydrogenase
MVPAGDATEQVVLEMAVLLSPGDVLIDGGNSNYRDSVRRAEVLATDGIHFLDVGTSGGIGGEERGYCLMVGGDATAANRLADLFEALAYSGSDGWKHVGPRGAGHFVKMIHNGIEYGMMQALAEGFALLDAKSDMDLDLAAISDLWRHGSIVSSRLLDHVTESLSADAGLSNVSAYVADSGEGRWTVQEAVDLSVPAPVITLALLQRFASRVDDSFANRLLSAMRLGFGGHQPKLL